MQLPTGSLLGDPPTVSFQSADLPPLSGLRHGDRIRITQGLFRGLFGRVCDVDDLHCLARLTGFSDGIYVRIPTDQVVAVED